MKNKSIVIIPARYASTRLPRKLLLDETGKPLIQYTYEAALKAMLPKSVLVACDHQEIFMTVKKFGGTVFMTDPNARSGTDRVAEVATKMDDTDIVVNVQGDEPEIAGESIDLVIRMLIEYPHAVMATLATPIRNKQQLNDPACVKVVFDQIGRALYFSRSVIPYSRNGVTTELLQSEPPLFYQHVGMYAYRRDFLLSLSRLPQSDLEKTESLEQLRVLHHGFEIMVGVVNEPTFGIDTPEDYKRFVEKLSYQNNR
ncbi:MAG: 3-deoxy-manno-octulosonate cytidylyltransferase [Planctomycetaceae bacterium]|jgi:3-deoxy-manno-octulosonate cytidylyltransferase (CMP-KDO synthetase)|nr:3-deoxy-manno-octulosonate cytidylyltransferase [Planctomycetaceae bacterium]